jgi:hypothetical protein
MPAQPDGLETECMHLCSALKPTSRLRPVRPAPGEARGLSGKLDHSSGHIGPGCSRQRVEANDRGETTACFDPSLNCLTLLPDDALELNLQNGRMRPFTVLAELDVAHDRVEGRAVSEGRHRYYLSHRWPGRRGSSQIARSRECVNALFHRAGVFRGVFASHVAIVVTLKKVSECRSRTLHRWT